MSVPPTGTVTFLFTDIEGSTRLWERDSSAMQAVLTRHDEILPGMPSADLLSSVNRCASLRQELEDVLGHGAHLAALVGDLDIRARPQVLLVDLGDGVSDRDRIPDKDRTYEPDAVVA